MILLPDSSRPRVSVVVVATGDCVAADRCLTSIAATTDPEEEVEVVLVLGGFSREHDELAKRAHGAQVVEAFVDPGVASGWNIGIDVSRAEAVLVVDETVQLRPGLIRALSATLSARADAGVVGARSISPEGESVHLGGGLVWDDGTVTGVTPSDAEALALPRKPFAVDFCSASCMLIARPAWDAIGGFDERLFPFTYVDVEFGLAVQETGRACLANPAATVLQNGHARRSWPRFEWWVWDRHRSQLLERWPDRLGRSERPPAEGTRSETMQRALSSAALGEPRSAGRLLPDSARRPLTLPPGAPRSVTATSSGKGQRVRRDVERRLFLAHQENAREFGAYLDRNLDWHVRELAQLR